MPTFNYCRDFFSKLLLLNTGTKKTSVAVSFRKAKTKSLFLEISLRSIQFRRVTVIKINMIQKKDLAKGTEFDSWGYP